MKHGKRWSICLLVGLMLLCFSTVSVAAYDQTSAVLSKMQGNWYDGNGNVVLDIEGQSINGNRHFDRTNFNCENSLSEFKAAYGFKQMPRAGQGVDLCYTRPGEYMWFNDYPNSITLTTYPLF